jgi:hypothetical protein
MIPVMPEACLEDMKMMLLPLPLPPLVVVSGTEDILNLMDALGIASCNPVFCASSHFPSTEDPNSEFSAFAAHQLDPLSSWAGAAMVQWRRAAHELIWARSDVYSPVLSKWKYHSNHSESDILAVILAATLPPTIFLTLLLLHFPTMTALQMKPKLWRSSRVIMIPLHYFALLLLSPPFLTVPCSYRRDGTLSFPRLTRYVQMIVTVEVQRLV